MTRAEQIADLKRSLTAYRAANDRGGNWETHRAEVVIERELAELKLREEGAPHGRE